MHVQIPTYIVRNDDISINNGDFMLYARLCLLHFKNYSNDEIKVDHKKLMDNLNISDTRTLKRRLESLYKLGLILNRPATMPRKGKTIILFNSNVKSKGNNFTMMNAEIFNHIDDINEHAFRLVFYYKSHINKNDNKNSPDKKGLSYCHVGFETLKVKLKMGSTTIQEANKQLTENKLIKIEKHKLENTGAYNEKDELIFDRYNNHYIVNEKLF